MVKLKRMLCDIDDPTVVVLMALIESQSAETLANWSLNYVEQNLLSIYQDKYPDDARLKHIICETRKYLAGTKTKKEQRMLLKEAKELIKDVEETIVPLAIVRAILIACATKDSPTNALGYTFYAVAAIVYHQAGLCENKEIYDQLAKEEFKKVLKSLQLIAIDNENNPVKVKWYC